MMWVAEKINKKYTGTVCRGRIDTNWVGMFVLERKKVYGILIYFLRIEFKKNCMDICT